MRYNNRLLHERICRVAEKNADSNLSSYEAIDCIITCNSIYIHLTNYQRGIMMLCNLATQSSY